MSIDSKSSERQLTRRRFLGTAAAAGAALSLGAEVPPARSANDRIGIGFIGVGGRGNNHLKYAHWLKTQGKEAVELVAVCDVYRPRLTRAAEGYQAKPYSDYRELLADKNVDLVCIATPDHQHGYQVIDAVRAGKDVYCEKPITHWRQFDLLKRLVEEVRKSGRVFQLGTQAMSDAAWPQMKKLVRDGAIGRPLFGETGFCHHRPPRLPASRTPCREARS